MPQNQVALDFSKAQPIKSVTLDFSRKQLLETPPEEPGFFENLSTGLGAEPGFVNTLKSMGGGLKHMITHPIDTAGLLAHGAADAQQQVIDKAYQEQQSTDPWTKARGYVRGAESAIPFLGPLLSKAGDEFSSGNIAGGLGTTAAIAAPLAIGAYGPKVPKAIAAVNRGRTWLAQKTVEPLVYENLGETGADVRMGINPEQAIVREGITGTKASMLEKASARTTELKQAANNILRTGPNASHSIDVEPIIDQAIDKAVANQKKIAGDTTRLENLRTALKDEYGPTSGTPFEINNLKTSIQEAANNVGAYKNTQPIEGSLADAMREVASGIKDKVNAVYPEAAELNQRMADLIDAQGGLQKGINAAKGRSIFGGFHEGAASTLLNRTLGSAPVRSFSARGMTLGLAEDVPQTSSPFAPPRGGQPLVRGRPTPFTGGGPRPMVTPRQNPVGGLPTLGFPAQPNLWSPSLRTAPVPQWEVPGRIITEPGGSAYSPNPPESLRGNLSPFSPEAMPDRRTIVATLPGGIERRTIAQTLGPMDETIRLRAYYDSIINDPRSTPEDIGKAQRAKAETDISLIGGGGEELGREIRATRNATIGKPKNELGILPGMAEHVKGQETEYHGASASSAEEIRKTGKVTAGDTTPNLARAKAYAVNWNPNNPGAVFEVEKGTGKVIRELPLEQEAEPVEVEIKGITEPIKPRIAKEKVVSVEKRFSPEEIAGAEGFIRQHIDAFQSGDRPGVYFDQTEVRDVYNPRYAPKGGRAGGNWRGVKSARNLMPWLEENPKFQPETLNKALRNKDSALYQRAIESAIEFMRRERLSPEEKTAASESVAKKFEKFTPPKSKFVTFRKPE